MLRRRSRSYAALALVVLLLVPAGARSECFLMTAKDVLSSPNTEQVFAGRVIEITRTAEVGYRATFEVDTVWKGAVPPSV